MRNELSLILLIAPALDLILGRGYNASHLEWRGIGRIVIGILFYNILTKAGQGFFITVMQTFLFPPGWPRIQSSLYLFF